MFLYFISKPPWDSWIYFEYLSIIIITNQVGSTPCVHLNIYDKCYMYSGVWKESSAVHLMPVILFLLLSPLIEFTQASAPPQKKSIWYSRLPIADEAWRLQTCRAGFIWNQICILGNAFFSKFHFTKMRGFIRTEANIVFIMRSFELLRHINAFKSPVMAPDIE